MICDRCHVFGKELCPKCGNSKHLREADENEPVLLIVLTAMQAMLVEPIIESSKIPYFRKGLTGGALTTRIGSMREIYSFYVPVREYKKCREMIEEVFIEDQTIMKLLHEFDA